jgi:hypothetical protein
MAGPPPLLRDDLLRGAITISLTVVGVLLIIWAANVLDDACMGEGFNPDCPGAAPVMVVIGFGAVVAGLYLVVQAAAVVVLLGVGVVFIAVAVLMVPLLFEVPGGPEHTIWRWLALSGVGAFAAGLFLALRAALARSRPRN